MAIINQVFNKNVPIVSNDPVFSGKVLSGVLYKDDAWLESSRHACVVLMVDPFHDSPGRVKFEEIARTVVDAGHYFYLAYNFSQSGSSDSPYVLSTVDGESIHHRMAYYGGMVTLSHLSHLANFLINNLSSGKPFTLVSQREMALGLVASTATGIDMNGSSLQRMVNNIVLLDPLLGMSRNDPEDYTFLSTWQALYQGAKCLMLFRSPIQSEEGTVIRKQARSIRLNFIDSKLIVAPVGDDGTAMDWVESDYGLWLPLALNHRESDGYTISNGEGPELIAGL